MTSGYPQDDDSVCCCYDCHVDAWLQNCMVRCVLHVIGFAISEACHAEQEYPQMVAAGKRLTASLWATSWLSMPFIQGGVIGDLGSMVYIHIQNKIKPGDLGSLVYTHIQNKIKPGYWFVKLSSWHNSGIPCAPYSLRVRIRIRVRITTRIRIRVRVRIRVRD